MIPKSIMLQVCSYCGEVAAQGLHGHDGQQWEWHWVKYVPKITVAKPTAPPDDDLMDLLADDDPPYR